MIALAIVVIAALPTATAAPDLNNEPVQPTQVIEQPKEQERIVEPTPDSQQVTWQDNPNQCTDSQWIAKEPPHQCIEKPTTPTQVVASDVVGSGSCADEIKKYDWNHTVAHNVMMAESKGNTNAVNNNPRTGDYSVGCFQVNLYGNLRNTRPSEAWLKNAANNVAYAYQLYSASGWSPWGATTCRYKVSCY